MHQALSGGTPITVIPPPHTWSMTTAPVDERTGDELLESLLEAHVSMRSAQRRLFAEIAEHDRRSEWRRMGAVSEEGFLSATLGVTWRTARSWVGLAHTMDRYPTLAGAFAAGELSEDQLHALAEIEAANGSDPTRPLGPFDDKPQPSAPDPTPDETGGTGDAGGTDDGGATGAAGASDDAGTAGSTDRAHEQGLLDLAGRLSARQLAAEARRRKRVSEEQANAAHRTRHFDISYDESDRRLRIRGGDLYDDQAAALWAALTDYAAGCSADSVTHEFEPLAQRFADGLTELALGRLANREQATGRAALVVHADARVLAGDDGWAETAGYAPLAAETIRRMACYCELFFVADDPDGNPIGVGRAQRHPPWWLADIVRRRDGHCRFPGCERRLFTQTHHIAEWEAHHGRTDLPNRITMCLRHHRAVHEGGWTMRGDPGGEMTFTSPDGIVLTSWPAGSTPTAATGAPNGTPPPDATHAGASPPDRSRPPSTARAGTSPPRKKPLRPGRPRDARATQPTLSDLDAR